MAVYVQLSADEVTRVAEAFSLGHIVAVEGVPQGSINSNFRLRTSSGVTWFLRYTTVRSADDLSFEASLLEHAQSYRVPVPTMRRTAEGAASAPLGRGRACVFAFLAGEELRRAALRADLLENLGVELGKLHRATASFAGARANPYGATVVRGWLEGLSTERDAEAREAAAEVLPALERALGARVPLAPRGVIHADLFLDNVKWLSGSVSALFDFEMACVDAYALDVAITLNAWCFDGRYQWDLARAFLSGYQSERPLSPVERSDLFAEALFGAVRYTASRLRDFHLSPLPPEQLVKKDFRTYLARVRELTALGPARFLEALGA